MFFLSHQHVAEKGMPASLLFQLKKETKNIHRRAAKLQSSAWISRLHVCLI